MIHPIPPPPAPRWSLAWQVGLALGVVLVVLLTALHLTGQTANAIVVAENQLLRSREQRLDVTAVLDALRDAETGQRGYLLTSQDAYLQPYEEARARIAGALARLTQASSGNSALLAEVAQLHDVANQKLAEIGDTVRLAHEHHVTDALGVVLSGTGLRLMDEARAMVAQMIGEIDDARTHELHEFYQSQRGASVALTWAAALGAGLLGCAVIGLLFSRDRILRMHETLRLQTARLGGAVEHMRDGVAVFAADGRLLLYNEHLIANAGWPAELLREGSRFADFAAAAAHWPGTPLAAPKPAYAGSSAEVKLGDKTLEVWRSPMPDGGQMLTIADVSRRETAEAVARQAQKMEALGQLTGGIAHDFNNLLQVVSANLELIADRAAGDATIAARLSAAMSGVERAARLTRHLLAFARRQPLAPRAIDTRALLLSTEDMLRRTLGERIRFEMVLGAGLWPVRADPQQLENALLNLAINARDAMPDGGRLCIEASNVAIDDEYAAANAEVSAGHYVAVAVSDSGVGMTAEQLARAIEPFYTTKLDGRGTGLGLSMVYGFARQTGGQFKLYSEPGQGTTARLYLPRSQAAPGIEVKPPEATQAEGEVVLVVEDDASVRAAASATLRGMGYRTQEADSTAAALALIEAGARPDVLFTDVVMPGTPSARAMAQRAQALLPGLPVVFTSGYTENSIVHNGQLDPGVILVSKPWRTPELARKLRQAILQAREPRAAATARRVLLVEDEMLVRMTTADLLADLGYEVVEASSAGEALDRLAAGADVLIADAALPDMEGTALAAEAVRRVPGLRVIITSGRDVAENPAYVVLDKPYNHAGLRAALEHAAAPRAAT